METGYRDPDSRKKASNCCVRSPGKLKAASWFLRNYRVLLALDSKLWTHSKATVQLKGLDSEYLEWRGDCQVAFDTLKEKLVSAPVLGLPDLQKPFKLYVHERQGIGLRILIQTLGNIP